MDKKQDLTEYVEKLYRAALQKTGDSYVAEDIVQETFLAAVQSMAKGKAPDNLWSWLLTVLSNKYSDYLREKYNRPHVSFEDYPFDVPDEHDRELALQEQETEQLEAVRRELGYLARTHREVMVRFYLHGDSIKKIARDLRLPAGTVKSRLNTGRKHIRERMDQMENYTKQSYQPDRLGISCSGSEGINGEPFSLVDHNDKLTQNVLILAYEKPVTENELAMALGVPAAFLEPIVEKMIDGELMKRTDGGRVYTDFIIYTEQDRKATFARQLSLVGEHFDCFWEETEKALSDLTGRDWYNRQSEHARSKLTLYFLVKLLQNTHIKAREGIVDWTDYPYRKNGGRWVAMGQWYTAEYDAEEDREFWKYCVNGEYGAAFQNYRDAKKIELRGYGTSLGECAYSFLKEKYVCWLYELSCNIPPKSSSVPNYIPESAEELIDCGILKKEGAVALDIPILTGAEFHEESVLAATYAGKLADKIRSLLLPLLKDGCVRLPVHLKSVPKWQQYMYCDSCITMAVIYRAIEEKRIFRGVDYKLPALVLVVDK